VGIVTALATSKEVYVFDACALIAFLFREDGAAVVDGLLINQESSSLAHAVNLCEVYYDVLRRHDAITARLALEKLQVLGVQTRSDLEVEFIEQVGRLKVNPGNLRLPTVLRWHW
jgi:PIN domain nuclease of toxin-antitoxin system